MKTDNCVCWDDFYDEVTEPGVSDSEAEGMILQLSRFGYAEDFIYCLHWLNYDSRVLPHSIQTFMMRLEQLERKCLLKQPANRCWTRLTEAYFNIGQDKEAGLDSASAENENTVEKGPGLMELNLPREELCEEDIHYILPDERYDPYELIRSPEFRDYYRRTELFGTEEVRDLIMKAYVPLQQKLDMLQWLREKTIDEETDNCSLDAMIRLYEILVGTLVNPGQRALYIVCSDLVQMSDCGCITPINMMDTAYENTSENFDSYSDMMATIQRYADEALSNLATSGMTGYEHADVTLVLWDEGGRSWSPASYQMECIDGKVVITDFSTESDEEHDWLMAPEFTHELLMDLYSADSIRYYPFPFVYGSEVSIQTSVMREPITGRLGGGVDGLSCAYHFLYMDDSGKNGADFIDLSYHMIGATGYSVWDWVRSADVK